MFFILIKFNSSKKDIYDIQAGKTITETVKDIKNIEGFKKGKVLKYAEKIDDMNPKYNVYYEIEYENIEYKENKFGEIAMTLYYNLDDSIVEEELKRIESKGFDIRDSYERSNFDDIFKAKQYQNKNTMINIYGY